MTANVIVYGDVMTIKMLIISIIYYQKKKEEIVLSKKIRENKIQGYLAYHNGKVVGWCNTNTKADCLKCYCWRRFMRDVPTEELASGIRVKSIFCFLVAPEFRRKGITKLLLERVCQDAVNDGFDFIEAYPLKGYINEAKDFMGPVGLFKKYGLFMGKQKIYSL